MKHHPLIHLQSSKPTWPADNTVEEASQLKTSQPVNLLTATSFPQKLNVSIFFEDEIKTSKHSTVHQTKIIRE